jgi:hypothetical protein
MTRFGVITWDGMILFGALSLVGEITEVGTTNGAGTMDLTILAIRMDIEMDSIMVHSTITETMQLETTERMEEMEEDR